MPSRKRPHNLKRFFEEYKKTGGSSYGVILLDDDDPTLEEYCSLDFPENWYFKIQPRDTIGNLIQREFESNPHDSWYGLLGDDIVPISYEWDKRLIQAAGECNISYCQDGIKNESQVTHFVIGGNLAKEVGWIVLEGLSRIYIDNVWNDIGKMKNALRYLPEVILDHRHYVTGKAPWDETYIQSEGAEDTRIYNEWVMKGRLF